MKTLIKNGTIHNFNESLKSDILIDNGKIIKISDNINTDKNTKVIDAENMFVLPGGIDAHTHLNLKLGDRQVSDGFYEGTKAAAFGGTTAIVDHPEGCDEKCSLLTKPSEYKAKLEKEAVIDFGIHGVFQRYDDEISDEIPSLINSGYSTAKVYTTYNLMLDYNQIEKIISDMKKNKGLTLFHAEEDSILQEYKNKYISKNIITPKFHPLSRPDIAESTAIRNILDISAKCKASVYIVHLSSKKGLKEIIDAKNKGIKVFTETCTQYLFLDDSYYEKEDGLKYVMSPPLRKKEDIEALWQAIKDNQIEIIATDHCSFSYADKIKYGSENVFNAPGGIPGVETRLPLLFNEMINKRNFSINKFVELTSYNPAKILGFSDKKGSIEIGKDADIVIWNPKLIKTISEKTLHQKCDYTPFEGFKVTGYPILTMLRGNIIVENGKFTGHKSQGKFIHRKMTA
jgi:dihydropyrimidinase